MTTPIQSAKGIPPSDYTRYCEKIAAEHEARMREQRRARKVRMATVACWIACALLIIVAFWLDLT